MSSLKSAVAILEQETNTVSAEERPGRPVLVTKTAKRIDDSVTRKVEAALDVDFANGSMPA